MATTIRERGRKIDARIIDYGYRDLHEAVSLPKCVIFDLDGTLALVHKRVPQDCTKCDNDIPNAPVIEALIAYAEMGYKIFILTARNAACLPEIARWLKRYLPSHLPSGKELRFSLRCRGINDFRADAIIKKEIYERDIKDQFHVSAIFDDRDSVVWMWREELHLPCFQVYYGNF